MFRLVMFDMDGTLLRGRTIFYLAEKKDFLPELQIILRSNAQPYEKSLKIASLLKGISKEEILSYFHEIPFQDHVIEVIDFLKNSGCIIALATDSYDIVANDIKIRLNLDYAYANNLIFNKSICTGEINIHNTQYFVDKITHQIYSISKAAILEKLCKDLDIPLKQSIAVGDGLVDCSMLHKAGLGIAIFASEEINRYADVVANDMLDILNYLKK